MLTRKHARAAREHGTQIAGGFYRGRLFIAGGFYRG